MKFYRWIPAFAGMTFFILFILQLGCGKPKPVSSITPTDQTTDGDGGTSVSPGDSLLPPVLFPHSDNWINPEIHGGWVVKNGTIECLKCHTATPIAAVEGPPACGTCHVLYPHARGWLNRGNHGAFVVENGTASCATLCHGADLKGGLSNVSCNQCHAVYPHSQNWNTADQHGEAARGDGKLSCKGCHGDDLRGGSSGVSCYSCHANYPHPANWQEAAQHGPVAYGNAKTSCATANCHGTAFEGSAQAPSCRACHADFPHVTPAWTTLTPGRESQRDDSFHGDRFIRRVQAGERTACTECHGTNYDRVLGQASCKQCHAFGITHKDINGAEWPRGGGHGKFFSDRFKATDAGLGCWKCHGNPVVFDASQTQNSLTTANFCYQCHAAYPHTGWWVGGFTALWEPVADSNCTPRRLINWAHNNYIYDSPLFADTQGTHPTMASTPPNSPLWTAAINKSCGSAGSCHTAGLRSYRIFTQPPGGGCGTSCHAAGAGVSPMPAFAPCEPDPSLRRPGPPTVVTTTPSGGAQNVAGDAVITIQFSEAMRESSLTGSDPEPNPITLKKEGLLVSSRISCDNNDWCKTVTMTPLVALREDGSQYQATITTAVKDFDGIPMAANYIWSFTTTNVDVTPPTVASTFPRDRKTNVSLSPIFTVEFSEPMEQTSVTGAGVYSLTLTSNASAVPISTPACVAATDCRKITFSLMSGRQLSRRTNYTVRVNSTVKDKAGNLLQNTYTWTFTTKN